MRKGEWRIGELSVFAHLGFHRGYTSSHREQLTLSLMASFLLLTRRPGVQLDPLKDMMSNGICSLPQGQPTPSQSDVSWTVAVWWGAGGWGWRWLSVWHTLKNGKSCPSTLKWISFWAWRLLYPNPDGYKKCVAVRLGSHIWLPRRSIGEREDWHHASAVVASFSPSLRKS